MTKIIEKHVNQILKDGFTVLKNVISKSECDLLIKKSNALYSKFGRYEGNGNADGPYIYTGFKPAWIMIKVSSGNTGGWDIYDNKRLTFNPNEEVLQANATSSEASSDAIDILSNGFKIRNTTGNQNGNGNTHVYMAFAEYPFVSSKGVPVTAR